MNPITELQNLIGQQLENNDRIEGKFVPAIQEQCYSSIVFIDIQQSLAGLYEVGPSPRFCFGLFKPLIQHAFQNVDIQLEVDMYVTVLQDLFTYMYENEGCVAHKLFTSFQNFTEGL